MPELPEVQTVVDQLRNVILGQKIRAVDVFYSRICEDQDLNAFLENQQIIDVFRRGKYIVVQLGKGYWITHLRMEGRFFIIKDDQVKAKHTHVSIYFDDFRLDYHDTRKFGRLVFTDHLEVFFKELGPEPFDSNLNGHVLKHKAKGRSIPLKSLILDQHFIAWIGNIYADESLFRAKLSPFKKAESLSVKDWDTWLESAREILNIALEDGGSTIRSYASVHGVDGRFQQHLKVYGRAHQTCVECKDTLKRGLVNQRSTVYCMKCQKVSQHAHRHYGIHR